MRRVVVIGASSNPSRYSYHCVKALESNNFEVIAIGKREGKIGNIAISTEIPDRVDIDTVIFYINKSQQQTYYDYVVKTLPAQIIFNPGTENMELAHMADDAGIRVKFNCALILIDSHLL